MRDLRVFGCCRRALRVRDRRWDRNVARDSHRLTRTRRNPCADHGGQVGQGLRQQDRDPQADFQPFGADHHGDAQRAQAECGEQQRLLAHGGQGAGSLAQAAAFGGAGEGVFLLHQALEYAARDGMRQRHAGDGCAQRVRP